MEFGVAVGKSRRNAVQNLQERTLAQERLVDWFSYWLKGEQDANPAKAEERVRWRELRKEYTFMHPGAK